MRLVLDGVLQLVVKHMVFRQWILEGSLARQPVWVSRHYATAFRQFPDYELSTHACPYTDRHTDSAQTITKRFRSSLIASFFR
jgi:hypothetical protein